MIKGIGIDILDLDRIKKIIAKGDLFAKKVLTEAEFLQYKKFSGQRQAEYLGGRFSCKESFTKAYGTGIGKEIGFQDLEILQKETGQPVMTCKKFSGKIFVSISHEKKYVITEVLLEENN
ncbi:holo-ACP synthase [Lactobacillus sp. PV037]|uniref:holo-ACP synthase n=1 Tax=unclassified Lactobacillus TaxID=2620435 RepID=UPI00223F66F7|nr:MULTISPECIES: holo-ACP synthase [unclassified Lactobacillus]QNQ81791.1 holo-ACP synthase [Lactobacillus sp. PV012]QNQ84165.1 holo-ACP synthase [Lactobacillus sp. PV037]